MKIWVIFLALLLINTSFFVYNSDMNRYVLLQENLKTLAADCAQGGVMYYDESAFSEGYYVIREEDGLAYMNHILRKNKKSVNPFFSSEVNSRIYFFDDSLLCRVYKNGMFLEAFPFVYPYLFDDGRGTFVEIQDPAVIVYLEESAEAIFRFDFLKTNSIRRGAMYENRS